MLVVAKRILSADIGLSPRDADAKAMQHPHFRSSARDQVKDVNPTVLSNAIDAADALLEAHRVPWQLEVDDDPAVVVKVQPFAGCVGGEQNAALPECGDCLSTCVARERPVKNVCSRCDTVADMCQRVAILRKDDRWFSQPSKQTSEGR